MTAGFGSRKPRVKAVFFDVDGTLISHTQKIVPDSTRLALRKLSELGIKRVISTGRNMEELSFLPGNDIAFDAYITMNGQLCLDGNGNIIAKNPILGEDKARIIRLFTEKSIPVMLVEENRMYINFIDSQVEQAQRDISSPLPEIGVYTGSEIYQAVVYLDQEQEHQVAALLSDCKITRWNDRAVDIISSTGGKASGIQAYLKANNIRKEETMAFGDGENDIEMLRYVQIGVAMGNADNDTKANADHITDSVDDDGILNALVVLNIIS